MRHFRTSHALLLIVVASGACQRAPISRSSNQADSASAAGASAPPAAPLAHMPSDTSCGFDTTVFNADAGALLEEYLRRDANGDFLRSRTAAWYGTAWMCPNHVGGWDAATLISSYRTHEIERADSISRFEVFYQVIGPLSQNADGMFLVEKPVTRVDTFVVLRTIHGWRLASPVQHQHITARAALGLESLTPQAKDRIRALVK